MTVLDVTLFLASPDVRRRDAWCRAQHGKALPPLLAPPHCARHRCASVERRHDLDCGSGMFGYVAHFLGLEEPR